MEIRGIEGLTADQINFELQRGGRFVIFQYAVSVLVMSFRRPSSVYFVRAGENTISKSIGFTLLTLVAGWWGIPWGPIYTIQSLTTNLRGGKNVTKQIVDAMNTRTPHPSATAPQRHHIDHQKPVSESLHYPATSPLACLSR
jgi:hypothetical protein